MSFGDPGRPKCAGRSKIKDGEGGFERDTNGKIKTRPCRNEPVAGATVCRMHGGSAKQTKAKAAIVAEVRRWGLGDADVDPGEVLLRLVKQSATRAEMYAARLAEAYDAADRLKTALEAEQVLISEERDEWDNERAESPGLQTAREDLRRIFTTGGVAALIGYTYADTKDGRIYATGEAIRGLAKLEAEERDRCAGFAAKAVAAGLATREVELAERQGTLMMQLMTALFDELDLTDAQREVAPDVLERHLRLLAG